MFEKAEEYLVKIFMNQSEENKFDYLSLKNDNNYSIGGIIKESNEAYGLYKRNNEICLKINNGKYILLGNKEKFVDSKEFAGIVENDSNYNKEDFKDIYENIDYVTFWESNKDNGYMKKLSYLVNKSTYLVTEYYKIFDDYSSILAVYDERLLNSEKLNNLGFLNPLIPDFDIKKTKKQNSILIVSDFLHNQYNIKENMKEVNNEFLRKALVKKINEEALEADRKSYLITSDFDECFEILKETLKTKFDENMFDGR